MNELLNAAAMGNIGDKFQQDDKNVVADVDKLINIVHMLVDTYGSNILEVYVAPADIIRRKTSELKYLKFFIVYSASITTEFYRFKEDVTDFLNVIVSDEFEEISKIDSITFSTFSDWNEPTLLLYTIFSNLTVEDLNDKDYSILYNLISKNGCGVSMPRTYKYALLKCILIHSPSTIVTVRLERMVKDYYSSLGIKIESVESFKKGVKAVYDIVLGLKQIPYDIPYLYIDKSSFNTQRLIDLGLVLPSDEEEEN